MIVDFFKKNICTIHKHLIVVGFFSLLLNTITPVYANNEQYTTIGIEITAWFSWSLWYAWWGIITWWLYYSNTTVNTVQLFSSLAATYILSWDSISNTTWTIVGWYTGLYTVILDSGDGIKYIRAVLDASGTNGTNILVTPPLWFFIDTQPPSIPSTLVGPATTTSIDSSLVFEWNASTDLGVWFDHYELQISTSPTFSTALSFTTTSSEIALAASSLAAGTWYRRLWVHDMLWNNQYNSVSSFSITSPTVWWWGGGGSIPPALRPDQCPNGDSSWNLFDGLCNSVEKIVLKNIPLEQQLTDNRPLLAKWKEKLRIDNNEPSYTFPHYSAPASYTIYEYPTANDTTFVDNLLQTQISQQIVQRIVKPLINNPGKKEIKNANNATQWAWVKVYWLYEVMRQLEQEEQAKQLAVTDDNYLDQRYNEQLPQCIETFSICLIEPICPDNYSYNSCNELYSELQTPYRESNKKR